MILARNAPPERPVSSSPMSKRDVSMTMIGLIMAIFFAMISNMVVLTAMPRIIMDLHGTQAEYTWIVTASLLTITVGTPIWGRMSDLLDKKRLIQVCIIGYAISSILAGLAPNAGFIILCRVGIGVGASGIIAMIQAISADIVPARQRARWVGYRGAAMAVATLGAPSLGGVITDHFGWRWCFGIGVPFAIISVIVIQRALRIPRRVPWASKPSQVIQLDWPGALLLSTGIVTVMVWASVAGPAWGWALPATLVVLTAGIGLIAAGLLFEIRSSVPLLPLELFRQTEVLLCVIAGAGIGIATFCSAVFLAAYLQIGRGFSAGLAGLLSLPEAAGTLIASLVVGHLIARTGRYKYFLIGGSVMVLIGFVLLSTLGTSTPIGLICLYVTIVGAGIGIVSENLILVVQNAVSRNVVGSAGALVAFFRSLGAVLGIAILGSVLSAAVAHKLRSAGYTYRPGSIPDFKLLGDPIRVIAHHAYTHGVAMIYLLCVPATLITLGGACLLPNRLLEAGMPAISEDIEDDAAGPHAKYR